MPFSVTKRIARANEEQQNMIRAKLSHLSEVLKKEYDIDGPRDDSRLSYLWACGKTQFTAEQIAKEIHRMHSLFGETDYKFVSETVVDKVSADLFTNHGLDKKTADIQATRYMIPAIKVLYNSLQKEEADPALIIRADAEQDEDEEIDVVGIDEEQDGMCVD
jgi:hypothetical protein